MVPPSSTETWASQNKWACRMREDSAIALDGLEHNFYFTLELHTTFVYTSQGPVCVRWQ